MAGTNNFLVFNEANNPTFTMSDADYYADLYRLNGLIPMIADPLAHNKMFRQWSIMIKALADIIASMNYNASDSDLATLKTNLKSTIEDVAEAKVDSRINTLEDWKESITASASEINILDGAEVTTTELNYLSGADSNIQTQINNLAISAFFPLRQNATHYDIGDAVKIPACKLFQYLECIFSGTNYISGDGSAFENITEIGPNDVGNVYRDGSLFWMVCDIRDGKSVGEIALKPFMYNDLKGYLNIGNSSPIIFDSDDNDKSWSTAYPYFRFIKASLNQYLYTYSKSNIFSFETTAGTESASLTSELLHAAGVILMAQWCYWWPYGLNNFVNANNLQYIDLQTFNTLNSLNYTDTDYTNAATKLLNDINNNAGGRIKITVNSLKDRFIKLYGENQYTSIFEDAGLPEIQGSFSYTTKSSYLKSQIHGYSGSNCFETGTTTSNNIHDFQSSGTSETATTRIMFKASNSNSIYGKSPTVRPANIMLCPYIKL